MKPESHGFTRYDPKAVPDRVPIYVDGRLVHVDGHGKVVERDPNVSDDDVRRVETAVQNWVADRNKARTKRKLAK